jgi:hypothetical protein
MDNRAVNYKELQDSLERICQKYYEMSKHNELNLIEIAKQRIPAWLLKLESIEDQINPSINQDPKQFKILMDRWVDAWSKVFFEVTKKV